MIKIDQKLAKQVMTLIDLHQSSQPEQPEGLRPKRGPKGRAGSPASTARYASCAERDDDQRCASRRAQTCLDILPISTEGPDLCEGRRPEWTERHRPLQAAGPDQAAPEVAPLTRS